MKITRIAFGRTFFWTGLILIFFQINFLITTAVGQTQGYYDSLNFAKDQLNQGQIQNALDLLEILEKKYLGEENLIRIKGQALYWSKDFETTKTYFRHSLKNYPDLYWAKLDYGRILYELNELDESQEVLESCLKINPDEPETNQKLAEINYWKGGTPKKSIEYLDKILAQFPDNEPAKAFRNEIKTTTSPYLGIASSYYSDSQPLHFFNLSARANFYHSAALQPGFWAEFRSYSSGNSVHVIQASNKFSLPKTRTSLLLRGGVVISSTWGNLEPVYGAELLQKFSKNFELNLSADQEAYLYTSASLTEPIIPFTYRAGFGREIGESWTGKVFWQNSVFEDENSVNTFGGWFLIPVLRKSILRVDLGYSLNLSDSEEVRFSEDLPITNTSKNTEIGDVIQGSYNPYFTPINQQVHGALGKINLNFSPKVEFNLTGNIGFLARIDNPNMIYYGSDKMNRNAPIPEEDIYLVLVETSYTPMDFKAVLNWKKSPKSTLALSYVYQKTIFFNNNSINLNYNFRIWND